MAIFSLFSLFLTACLSTVVHSGPTTCPKGPGSADTVSGGMVYTYPWPIKYHQLTTQRQHLCQAYADLSPKPSYVKKPERNILLLHGKNFCAATWEATAKVLRDRGFRVIAPDQIGFCKSDKPDNYQFSLQQLAVNTKSILDTLGVKEMYVMGHSMGGMLAVRFALMYPSLVKGLVMIDPIGLEDWKSKGVPYLSVDEIYKQERASDYTSIKGYEQATYYVGKWDSAYDKWVNMLLKVYKGSKGDAYAYNQALITDMVMTQPVVYELPLLKDVRSLLIVGDKDNTAIGKQWSPPDVQKQLGHYDVLGRQAKEAIGKNCTYVHFKDLGHAPQIQDPDRLHEAVLGWLEKEEGEEL